MQSQGFWLQDMNLKEFEGEHKMVSLLAIAGLAIWSLGVPFTTYLVCRFRRSKLQDFRTKRLLGLDLFLTCEGS